MTFDFYADHAILRACPTDGTVPGGLASGFVDGCTAWSARGGDEKNQARRCYRSRRK
jgi:CRISPR-associated protein Cmr2